MAIELTTIADDLAVFHDGSVTHRHEGLTPATDHELHGIPFRTLPRPPGALLARVATVNDVHFGEVQCGMLDGHTDGPILRRAPGEEPYPELMSRGAVGEIAAIDPAAVFAKGDLTAAGDAAEFAAFEACYAASLGDRLHVVRGNHDACGDDRAGAGAVGGVGGGRYSGDRWVEVPGLTIVLLDTVRPTETPGHLTTEQLAELDDRLAGVEGRVLLLGHHQQYVDGPYDDAHRSPDYFGLDPDASDELDRICARRPGVIGYAAGHTHRHRVRPMTASDVPSIEIGCVKDFPGTWAEYRVFEGGVMQVVHRVSDPEALAWSDRCRVLYSDFGVDYEAYALGELEQRCFVFPDRG